MIKVLIGIIGIVIVTVFECFLFNKFLQKKPEPQKPIQITTTTIPVITLKHKARIEGSIGRSFDDSIQQAIASSEIILLEDVRKYVVSETFYDPAEDVYNILSFITIAR